MKHGDREWNKIGHMDDTSSSYGRRSRPAAASAHGETRIIHTQLTDTPSSYREETTARNYYRGGEGGIGGVGHMEGMGHGLASGSAQNREYRDYERDYQSFNPQQIAGAIGTINTEGENGRTTMRDGFSVNVIQQQQPDWRIEPKRRSYRSRSLDNQRDFILHDYLLMSERGRMRTPAVDYPLDSASIRNWPDARLDSNRGSRFDEFSEDRRRLGTGGRRDLNRQFYDDYRLINDNPSGKERLAERGKERLASYHYPSQYNEHHPITTSRDISSSRNYEFQPNMDTDASWNVPPADVHYNDDINQRLSSSSYRPSQLYSPITRPVQPLTTTTITTATNTNDADNIDNMPATAAAKDEDEWIALNCSIRNYRDEFRGGTGVGGVRGGEVSANATTTRGIGIGTGVATTLPSFKRDYQQQYRTGGGGGGTTATTTKFRHDKSSSPRRDPDKKVTGGGISSLLIGRRRGKFTTVSGRTTGGAVASSGVTSGAGTRSGLGALFSSSSSSAVQTTSSRPRAAMLVDSELKSQSGTAPFNVDAAHAYHPSLYAQQVLTTNDDQQQQQQRFGTVKAKTAKKFHRFGGASGNGGGTFGTFLKPKFRSKSSEFIYSPSSSTAAAHSGAVVTSGGIGAGKYEGVGGGISGRGELTTTASATGVGPGSHAANRSTSLTHRPHSQFYQPQQQHQQNRFSYNPPPYENTTDRMATTTEIFHPDEHFVAPSIFISGDQSSYPQPPQPYSHQYRQYQQQHRSGGSGGLRPEMFQMSLEPKTIKTMEPLSITTTLDHHPTAPSAAHRTVFNVGATTDNKQYPAFITTTTNENVREASMAERISAEQKFYKIHCCCMSFRWPPWRYEEVDAPQPIYRHQQ